MDRDKAQGQMQHDKLEQYMRRDNLLFSGIKEAENETENDIIETVMEIADAIDATIRADISTAHRIGRKGDKPRPVIVRFTARKDRNAILKNKKNLKDNENIKKIEKVSLKVGVQEDVTEPRRRLLKMASDSPHTEFAFIKDGTILCKTSREGLTRIETADDLWKLGYTDVKYDQIYGHQPTNRR